MKISNWELEYENLKIENIEMQEKYEIKIRKIKNQKKEIKQTFRIVQ